VAGTPNGRHSLLHFRDETFECGASSWAFEIVHGCERPPNKALKLTRSAMTLAFAALAA
jgi:hypothetical protein